MGNMLKYGDRVHIQNGYQNWQGGYLDTCGNSTTGIKYGVSTADTPARADGTGTWEILSATGKAKGQDVLSGDIIYLKNLYGGDGGYLDVAGDASPDPCTYQVGTAAKPDRDSNGTSRWRVFAQTSSPTDNKVREDDVVHLFNETTYNNAPGGFLDTYGTASGNAAGNKYGVVTSAYADRTGEGTSSWRFTKVPIKDVLKYGDKIHIQNGYQNWQGGYLDSCNQSTTGIKYDVSTSDTPTRAAGTGTWEIISATGKPSGADVLSGDVIYLKNLYGGDGGYLDACGNASPAPCIYQVGTAAQQDRAGIGTAKWKVLAKSSYPGDKKVRELDVVHFFNTTTHNNAPGGFLDTYGGAIGNKYDVVTGAYADRAGQATGSWRMIKVKA
ncbi:hypothetical protein [Sorangium sp. So ce1078]|uniref:hypothetical protein n=1 Tax=Sorangium sp. So ce1078 TaxID=3133329 RepID=UPI003F6124A6